MPNKTLICVDCNKLFEFTDKSQLIFSERGFPDPKRCYDCRQGIKVIHPDRSEPRPADKSLTCISCGEQFIFTGGEQDFYKSKGFHKPSWCKKCRDKKRASEGRGP